MKGPLVLISVNRQYMNNINQKIQACTYQSRTLNSYSNLLVVLDPNFDHELFFESAFHHEWVLCKNGVVKNHAADSSLPEYIKKIGHKTFFEIDIEEIKAIDPFFAKRVAFYQTDIALAIRQNDSAAVSRIVQSGTKSADDFFLSKFRDDGTLLSHESLLEYSIECDIRLRRHSVIFDLLLSVKWPDYALRKAAIECIHNDKADLLVSLWDELNIELRGYAFRHILHMCTNGSTARTEYWSFKESECLVTMLSLLQSDELNQLLEYSPGERGDPYTEKTIDLRNDSRFAEAFEYINRH